MIGSLFNAPMEHMRRAINIRKVNHNKVSYTICYMNKLKCYMGRLESGGKTKLQIRKFLLEVTKSFMHHN